MNHPLFADTITLYNHYMDLDTMEERWQRTVLCGVQYREKSETDATESNPKQHESISISIPANVDASGRRYLAPDAFAASANREKYWTLDAESNRDVVVFGDCEAEVADASGILELQRSHKIATVTTVHDNTLRRQLKHWKVSCTRADMKIVATKRPIESKTGDGYKDDYQPLLGSLQPLSGSLVAQMYGERLRSMRLLLAAPDAPVNEGDGVCVDVPGEESPDFKVVYVARWPRHLVAHLEYIPKEERVRRDAD